MKAQFFLFNIESYGEFFSGITPGYNFLKIYTGLFSLKLNIFPVSASILTFSTQNHLILKYFTNF
jgi:hypothetical protein